MIRKMAIFAAVLWVAAMVGGVLWAPLEARLHRPSVQALEIEKLQDLYGAKLYDEVLKECDEAEMDRKYIAISPQLLYVRWAADRQLQNTDEAARAEHLFLQRFPNHPLAADIHFSIAIDLLGKRDYLAADKELMRVQTQFPDSSLIRQVRGLRRRLAATTQGLQ